MTYFIYQVYDRLPLKRIRTLNNPSPLRHKINQAVDYIALPEPCCFGVTWGTDFAVYFFYSLHFIAWRAARTITASETKYGR